MTASLPQDPAVWGLAAAVLDHGQWREQHDIRVIPAARSPLGLPLYHCHTCRRDMPPGWGHEKPVLPAELEEPRSAC